MSELNAEAIAKGLDKGVKTATGWAACCPAHNDKSPSLTIADGNSGFPVVHCHGGCTQDEVIAKLKDRGLWPEFKKAAPAKAAKAPPRKVVAEYDYVDPETGECVYQVVRFEPKDFRQRKPLPGGGWAWTVPAKDRILYNLVAVSQSDPKKIVFVVEGEKDVDKLAALGIVATCNTGGGGKWDDRYSEALRGRKVVILPDNDETGEKHLDTVGASLQGVAEWVRTLRLPGLPEKGDVSDWIEAGGDRAALVELVRAATPWEPRAAADPEPLALDPGSDSFGPAAAPEETVYGYTSPLDEAPFSCLGYNDGTFFYLPVGAQQVVALSPAQHTKSNLLALAPLGFWEDLTGENSGKTGFNVDFAANVLIQTSYARGLFSMEQVRGRGAWWDAGRTVVHVGDRAYVNGEETPLTRIGGPFVYERGLELDVNLANPLSADEARKFLEGVRMMTWANDLDSLLTAGWCVVSQIGGVMLWRPHIWIIGAKGSGKTFFMENFLKPVLGENQANGREGFVGETTAAGIRQVVGGDALPVVLDEAEGETSKAVARLQEILALARGSSSGSGKITKGTSGGNALTYKVRSCFALSSINASIVQSSDQSRISVVELKNTGHKHSLADLSATLHDIFKDGYSARFFSRAVVRGPMIREAARTFTAAAAIMFGEQRAGDQYGTLLAGAWSLTSDEAPTLDEAREWLAAYDWRDTTDEVSGQDDAVKCLEHLMALTIKVDTSHGTKAHTIAELVEACSGGDTVMSDALAQAALNRHGLKVHEGRLYVANSGPETSRLLRDTPWSVNWNKVLVRLPGAEKTNPTSFGSKFNQKKAIRIPLKG